MSGSPKALKERLNWLEQNEPIFKKEKQEVIKTIQELRLKKNESKFLIKSKINKEMKLH